MLEQLELVMHSKLATKPEPGHLAPRFWVRRLVIWEKPGTILREITLRPGLNIVWSPDPADRGSTSEADSDLGHGSGKTLFCRLLRYILGEDRFSPDDQRYHIAQALPGGMVGAEVMVDGTQWAVLRPIGHGRQHFAVPDADLHKVLAGEFSATGIEPLLQAIENQILSADVVGLMPIENPRHAWPVALAWLSRDQECRFDKVLDWRSPDSDSGSPARGLSATKLLDALRTLIRAIVPEEYKLRAEIGAMEQRQKESIQDAERRTWEANRLKARLIKELGLNPDDLLPGRLAVEPMRRTAKARLAQLATVAPNVDVTDLAALRAEADKAQQHVESLDRNLAEVTARIPEVEALIARIRGERPGLSVEIDKLENPLCPVCDVPIDHALAQGCNLSHRLQNPAEAKQRLAQFNEDLKKEAIRLENEREESTRLKQELTPARMRAEELRQRVQMVERARDARLEAWYQTRRLIDDANRLEELLLAQEQISTAAENLTKETQEKRELTGAFRDAQADVFRRLSWFFDAIIREVVGSNAGGQVSLDGNGLKLSVELGGERSTAAIDSLKVIAFDLAVMCMSIEGRTCLPAFLLHDSPREADLGLSVYHRLFNLLHRLEQEHDGQPLFQYIVTTTTRPPDNLLMKPWLSEMLGGAPADARLLKRNL